MGAHGIDDHIHVLKPVEPINASVSEAAAVAHPVAIKSKVRPPPEVCL